MIFDDYTYLHTGDSLPEVDFVALEKGKPVIIKEGEVLLLSFFIIPCKHCKDMLEYIQDEIWPLFQNSKKNLLVIGRGHKAMELEKFRDAGNYLLPFAADPERKNYDKFAEKKVPRNYLFNSQGRLIFQTRGFDSEQMFILQSVLLELDME